MSNKQTRRLKGYYGFSKKYPSKRGTVYAIGESKRMKKKERRNKILLTVLCVVAFIAVLTFYMFCRNLSRKPIPSKNELPKINNTVSAENIGQIKAIYIDNATLGDDTKLDDELKKAKDSGFNAIMLDFKDEDGNVLYQSSVAASSDLKGKVKINSAHINKIKNNGFTVVARVYCFCDSVAPQRLGAFVYEDAELTKPWFDNAPALGGRVWLNPTDARATNYLCSIISEVANKWADCVYLDGVEFPTSNENTPVFTEDDTNLSRNFVLLSFVEQAVNNAGSCPVILGFSYDGIDGDSEKWGGTLFDSAASVCSPEVPMTDNYSKYVGDLWVVLNERAKDNYSTLKVIPTINNCPQNESFISELASFGAESYIIIP